jgi:hypothetical protein
MTKLKFSDGVEIETGGEFRIITLADGIYVTGHGFLYPCKNYEEAQKVIKTLILNTPVKDKK